MLNIVSAQCKNVNGLSISHKMYSITNKKRYFSYKYLHKPITTRSSLIMHQEDRGMQMYVKASILCTLIVTQM